MRRCWWVLVSFSYQRRLSSLAMALRTNIVAESGSARFRRSQRSAHISPRRAPVVIASHTKVPQSGSVWYAWLTIVAACSAVGGFGFG